VNAAEDYEDANVPRQQVGGYSLTFRGAYPAGLRGDIDRVQAVFDVPKVKLLATANRLDDN
jgi:hypothetical protein